jgi:hypothetical protein
MGTTSGKYTTKRDGGVTYSYEASWGTVGDRAHWSAKVKREGNFAGTPNGQILNTQGVDLTEDGSSFGRDIDRNPCRVQ